MKIKFFNLNTWLLPFPFSKHHNQRINFTIQTIKTLNPDIITLQEVALKKEINKLKKGLPDYNEYHNSGKVVNRAGLLTMTKEKSQETKFIPFPKSKGRKLAKVMKRGLLLSKFKDYNLINTHLYPDNWGDESITFREFELVKKYCDNTKPTLVAGDLNMKLEPFTKVNKEFFECVDSIGNTISFYNIYVKKWWEKNFTANKKLDYILIRNPEQKEIRFKSRIIRKPILSDHYGVYSKIEIK